MLFWGGGGYLTHDEGVNDGACDIAIKVERPVGSDDVININNSSGG